MFFILEGKITFTFKEPDPKEEMKKEQLGFDTKIGRVDPSGTFQSVVELNKLSHKIQKIENAFSQHNSSENTSRISSRNSPKSHKSSRSRKSAKSRASRASRFSRRSNVSAVSRRAKKLAEKTYITALEEEMKEK